MHASVYTVALEGLQGHIIEVEVFIASGLPRIEIVGMAGRAVQESKERINAAIRSSGFEFPLKRIIVNLAPADLVKSGPGYDLPIAVAILSATGQIQPPDDNTVYWGELSLEGQLRPVNGVLAIATAAKRAQFSRIVVPDKNARDAGIVAGITVSSLETLAGVEDPVAVKAKIVTTGAAVNTPDFAEIRGQGTAKRALEIAAAGMHNILLSGTPGAGKTFMAHALAGILPAMDFEEQLEVTTIHSVAGISRAGDGIMNVRPFRSPHHTCSHVALIGGGSIPRPGEVTLAHRGVLFLDEFTEFDGRSLESLRQPLQDRTVTIARAAGSITYPADFLLVAAMNPCKCGYLGDPVRDCVCTPFDLERYTRRLSGPLLDRIDLQVFVPRLTAGEMRSSSDAEKTSAIRKRVELARQFSRDRAIPLDAALEAVLGVEDNARRFLVDAVDKLSLSQRSYFSMLRVGRTIADLAASVSVKQEHLEEALAFRKTAT
ncbi:MAG: Competence protein ComM [candidate division WS6 bacterium OLB20]|uniref:Competence protein ComM n=1 Tax=candidate division WS6 bacterium OLB20 TaxID=1617426 RepID=A0A136LZ66_9BACT|nr:MAG: Competence protein ComM [candidate division WS6 bacterium OLB20]